MPDGAPKYCRRSPSRCELMREILRSENDADVVQDYTAWIEWLGERASVAQRGTSQRKRRSEGTQGA